MTEIWISSCFEHPLIELGIGTEAVVGINTEASYNLILSFTSGINVTEDTKASQKTLSRLIEV